MASLEGLTAFVHSVEAGSFAAAADRLGLTRSAVAKAVRRLEERLGVQLLHRTTRRLSPTPDGSSFYEHCRRILEELDAAEALMSSRRRAVSGLLRVSLPSSFGRLWALPPLLELAAGHEGLVLDAGFTDRYVDLHEEGIDLAVRIGAGPESGSLLTRRLATQRSTLCAAPAYLARQGRPERPEALDSHSCLVFQQGGRTLPWRLADGRGGLAEIRPESRLRIGDGEALLDAALAGLGIAQLSTWLIGDHLAAGRLIEIWPETRVDDQPIRLVWPERRDGAPKVRAAIDALLARLQPHPPWDP